MDLATISSFSDELTKIAKSEKDQKKHTGLIAGTAIGAGVGAAPVAHWLHHANEYKKSMKSQSHQSKRVQLLKKVRDTRLDINALTRTSPIAKALGMQAPTAEQEIAYKEHMKTRMNAHKAKATAALESAASHAKASGGPKAWKGRTAAGLGILAAGAGVGHLIDRHRNKKR